jgi:hypothetical protein
MTAKSVWIGHQIWVSAEERKQKPETGMATEDEDEDEGDEEADSPRQQRRRR